MAIPYEKTINDDFSTLKDHQRRRLYTNISPLKNTQQSSCQIEKHQRKYFIIKIHRR